MSINTKDRKRSFSDKIVRPVSVSDHWVSGSCLLMSGLWIAFITVYGLYTDSVFSKMGVASAVLFLVSLASFAHAFISFRAIWRAKNDVKSGS